MNNFFTNRHGGFSHGDYSSWNLASHVGDDLTDVERNRDKLRERVGEFAIMSQVHGDTVVIVDQVPIHVPVADALITANPEVALVVMVADCIPLLLKSNESVAAVHVGRRGLVNEITRKTLTLMRDMGASQITAIIGPAICGSCYEVSEDIFNEVVALHPIAQSRTPSGTYALNLPAALRSVLNDEGVEVVDQFECTVESEDYFSYRRDGVTGRQAGVISL